MKDETYDICITGAGIAGATLAHNLAGDFDVCLVEKEPFGELGRKPCGNAVHRSWLEHDGVEPDPERFGAVSSVSRSLSLHLPGEELRADLDPERELLILDKEKLVKGLVSSALDRGCDLVAGRGDPEVEDGGVRGVDAGDASIGAETYVDASGSAASLRENFEPTPPDSFFPGYREIVDTSLGDGTCHAFQPDSSHALWVFPAGGRTNVGGVLFREDGASLKPEVRRLRRDLGLDGRVLNSGFGPIPSSKPIDLVHGNVVAIGDAGFTANPLTGGGIGPQHKGGKPPRGRAPGRTGSGRVPAKVHGRGGGRLRAELLPEQDPAEASEARAGQGGEMGLQEVLRRKTC
ncbi:hypothetical protein AKJ65_03560 [candidate division MSBL1 archaeon SCGC-AAA259E19]|uniref:FAD dependent oxidoreductase domain-containing protein n=1 Tax=candidate division MSBL1 archaeon SCGC-AAA259E19 TaxID=1698264 RepID=A0A133UKM2_9EURY|nr:hypothetical protein AKJ65_03560 [candidate division MSBL1 archaeon SCGC-AAA259E19]